MVVESIKDNKGDGVQGERLKNSEAVLDLFMTIFASVNLVKIIMLYSWSCNDESPTNFVVDFFLVVIKVSTYSHWHGLGS